MSKNKKPKEKSSVKVYQMDINIDTNKVADGLLIKPLSAEEQFSYQRQVEKWNATPQDKRGARPVVKAVKLTGPEFFKDIVMKAVAMVHKTGNVQSLRRTRSISDQLVIAIEKKKGILDLMEDDYDYIKRAMVKADEWNNIDDVARSVLVVDDILQKAETL